MKVRKDLKRVVREAIWAGPGDVVLASKENLDVLDEVKRRRGFGKRSFKWAIRKSKEIAAMTRFSGITITVPQNHVVIRMSFTKDWIAYDEKSAYVLIRPTREVMDKLLDGLAEAERIANANMGRSFRKEVELAALEKQGDRRNETNQKHDKQAD